jgi:uncharacterized protein involved in cysteine biosynthesis
VNSQRETPTVLEEFKHFIEFLQNLWAILASVSVLFPLSNMFAQIVPVAAKFN